MSIRIFTGIDSRESVGWHVFTQSVLKLSSMPVEIVPVTEWLGVSLGAASDGTNAFSKSRFLVPYLCEYRGWALWCDGADMLMRADLAELWALRDSRFAVQVVQHNYTPKAKRKYIGTAMAADNVAYPRKNWSSVILWNCAHPANCILGPESIRGTDGKYLHRFAWLKDEALIGAIPDKWNWLDEYGERSDAALVHYTNGLPGFLCYRDAPFAQEWRNELKAALQGLQIGSVQIDQNIEAQSGDIR